MSWETWDITLNNKHEIRVRASLKKRYLATEEKITVTAVDVYERLVIELGSKKMKNFVLKEGTQRIDNMLSLEGEWHFLDLKLPSVVSKRKTKNSTTAPQLEK